MAKKYKQKKKRMKKYQGTYVTADRLDMSKGGRVQKAVGGMQKNGMNEGKYKAGNMSIGGPGGGKGGPGANESDAEAKKKAEEAAKKAAEEAAKKAAEEAAKKAEDEAKALAATPQMTGATTASQQRTGRISKTAEQVQA